MKTILPFLKGRVYTAWPSIARVLTFSCLLSMTLIQATAQIELIKDIDTREEILNNEYSRIAAGSTITYFVSWSELWRTGGTAETSILLKKFKYVSSMMTIGNTAYFAADDGSGLELWKSNGTVAGTIRIKDIWPGTSGSNPELLTNVGGTVYFVANNGKNGRELWKTNGTATGTVMVKDILPVSGSSMPAGLTNVNGVVYFSANNGMHGYELWKSNGTAEGTVMVKDIRTASKVSSSPLNLRRSNGLLFFSAIDDGGRELWKSDGTAAGTVKVKDIRTGGDSDVDNLIDANGTLFFTANDGIHGDELWKSNGTSAGTVMVKDMNPGSAGSNSTDWWTGLPMHSFRSINGKIFFIASVGHLDYVYRSDGTAAGTIRVQLVNGTGMNPVSPVFTYMLGYVYFFGAEGGEYGPMYLWKMHVNGTTATKVRLLETPVSYYDYYYENHNQAMVQCNNILILIARLRGSEGFKVIRSDGTEAGTMVITDSYVNTLSSNPRQMTEVNGFVFFRTVPDPHDYLWPYEGDYHSEQLYRTDGSAAGTYPLPGYFQDENEMAKAGNTLFYTINTDVWNLRKTDGNTITQISSGTEGQTRPTKLTGVGNALYYTNGNHELWRSDGTSGGTVNLGQFASISSIHDVNGKAYIMASNAGGGLELWTAMSTGPATRVKTIRDETAMPSKYHPTLVNGNTLYFVANDGLHGNEVWQSDGTSAGTHMLFDLNVHDPATGDSEFDINSMAFANGHLVISAMDANLNWMVHSWNVTTSVMATWYIGIEARFMVAHENRVVFIGGSQMFSADGMHQPAFLADLDVYPDHVDYAVVGNALFASLSPYTTYIWRTDGTPCGTEAMFIESGTAYMVEGMGSHLILAAAVASEGYEPHIYRNIPTESPCSTVAMSSTTTDESVVMTPYPNPFTNNFTLRVNGGEEEIAEVGVYTANGFPVEKFQSVKANTDYANIGQNWARGIYIVKVNKGGVLTSHTVVKE
jgi:ELWxxDGT repeat protein